MKDPMFADGELVGGVSELKNRAAGREDAFRWETAYRELGQAQLEQRRKARLLREGGEKSRDISTRSFESAAGPIVKASGSGDGFSGVDRGIAGRERTEEAPGSPKDERAVPLADCTKELTQGNDELRSEIAERKRAEAALQAAYAELEQGAADRTNELMRVNGELRTEIAERKRAEAMMQAAYAELEQGAADRANELMRVNGELRTEIAERKRTEEALRAAQAEREASAADREDELMRANDGLRTEIAECERTEEALRAAQAEREARAAERADELMRVSDELRTEIAERKNAQEQLEQILDHFQKMVGTTVQVMGSAVEIKDPHAAGHQSRSSALARGIARMMGLSRDQINTLRMAGSIHDIGKLSIPAEILSKPGKLSEYEFPLVKRHAERGYEILKDIEFPWPLAEIVRQHHERMDGSGYPRNLKGDEICVEARIMAVADVVEAMVSHRPYRPALGIEAALEEIETNSGTLYDRAVADACLQLFREEDFQFAEG